MSDNKDKKRFIITFVKSSSDQKKERKMTPPTSPQETQKNTKSRVSVAQIDEQIEALQNKKKRLEIKQAERLMKNAQKILGEEYSDTFVLKILATAVQEIRDNPEQKEAWMKAPLPFRDPPLPQERRSTKGRPSPQD